MSSLLYRRDRPKKTGTHFTIPTASEGTEAAEKTGCTAVFGAGVWGGSMGGGGRRVWGWRWVWRRWGWRVEGGGRGLGTEGDFGVECVLKVDTIDTSLFTLSLHVRLPSHHI